MLIKLGNFLSISKEQHGYTKPVEEYKSQRNKIEARKLAALRASGWMTLCHDINYITEKHQLLQVQMAPGIFKRCDYESISKI